MNYSTAVFLINPNVRAVLGIYEAEEDKGQRPVPRTAFKTLDHSIKVGDFVLVPSSTRHKMTVNKVVEVDVDVDFDSGTQMTWIIGKVDRADHEKINAMEHQAIQTIKSAELRKKKDELRKALIADSEALKALPIASAQAHDDEPVAFERPPSPPQGASPAQDADEIQF